MPPVLGSVRMTSSCGRSTGRARRTMAWMRLKMAVLAPMPRPRLRTATAVKAGLWRRDRAAKRRSCQKRSMGGDGACRGPRVNGLGCVEGGGWGRPVLGNGTQTRRLVRYELTSIGGDVLIL